MRRRLAAFGVTAGLIPSLILGLLLGLAACGDPDQQMLSEGARSAREAVSGVRTARLAAQSLLDGKIWAQPALLRWLVHRRLGAVWYLPWGTSPTSRTAPSKPARVAMTSDPSKRCPATRRAVGL